MSDLVNRLKTEWTPIYGGCVGTMFDAADYIERLEGALRKIVEINNKRDRFSNEIDQIAIEVLGGANV